MITWLTNLFKYWFNDPSTPNLSGDVELPMQAPGAQVAVQGFNGQGGVPGSPEQQAIQVYITLVESLNYAKRFVGDRLSRFTLANPLPAYPRFGQDWNAFYDRSALKFFFAMDPETHKTIFTCESADVCSHELGHAILDALRPDLWSLAAMEVWSFHESFGDISAMLHAMLHDEMIDYMLMETNSNLRLSNVCTKVGEEMGTGIFHATGGRVGGIGYLRDAVNTFTYSPPEVLPHKGPDSQLCAEPHSFSRVFTAAWYDMFVGMYEVERAAGKEPKIATQQARDAAAMYTFLAIPQAAATVRFYSSIASAFLLVDKQQGSRYQVVIQKAFQDRFILSQVVAPVAEMHIASFADIAADETIEHDNGVSLTVRNSQTLKLAGDLPPEWQGVEIQVPADHAYEFDGSGLLKAAVGSTHNERLAGAMAAVGYLHANEMENFEIVDGKLVRKHFSCDCFINNSTVPGAPELGKPWKPENNGGCCPGCKPKDQPPEKPVVKNGCYVRYNGGTKGCARKK
jgi:hypothetical protein